MYSWGTDTKNWKKPDAYKYDSARAPYLDKLGADASKMGPRSYVRPASPDMGMVDPHGKNIASDSTDIVVVGIDGTGSMATWPAEIFDRLPLFYQTLSQYRPNLEISFGVIGDANSDEYPLQVNGFGKGLDLEKHLKALYPEGNGGGQISESYELYGYFMANHCQIPKAVSPYLFIFGDEKFYGTVEPRQVKTLIGDTMQDSLDSARMWRGLAQKFNVFYLHKPYGRGDEPHISGEVRDYWVNTLGDERVIELPSKDRAVDVAMGIVAKYWGQFNDFTKSMGARHDDSTIDAVVDSIRFIPDEENGPITRNSRLLRSGRGGKSAPRV